MPYDINGNPIDPEDKDRDKPVGDFGLLVMDLLLALLGILLAFVIYTGVI